MIDPNLFTVERLLACFLDDTCGNVNAWRKYASIVQCKDLKGVKRWNVMMEFGDCKVYLRYSCGPAQGYFWDIYGDDMQSPELAFMALLQAPVPPQLVRREKLTTK